jgi:signal peptidase I
MLELKITRNDMSRVSPNNQLRFRSLRNTLLTILLPVLIAIILRIFFIEFYKIQSSSMETTLLPGDIIMVSKMSYGTRFFNPCIFLKNKKIDYIRTKGWSSIKKGDIFVFNWLRDNVFSDSSESIFGDYVVKRCYGMPGDTVLINNERGNKIKRSEEISAIQLKNNLFPFDSMINWSVDHYGPLYVPAKGQTMKLTKRNVYWYKDILRYEIPQSQIEDSSIIINGKPVLRYTFKHNYYFMVGDNFYFSQDSRYLGFVPGDNIIGKSVLILYSIDPNNNGFKKIRWGRFFKKI